MKEFKGGGEGYQDDSLELTPAALCAEKMWITFWLFGNRWWRCWEVDLPPVPQPNILNHRHFHGHHFQKSNWKILEELVGPNSKIEMGTWKLEILPKLLDPISANQSSAYIQHAPISSQLFHNSQDPHTLGNHQGIQIRTCPSKAQRKWRRPGGKAPKSASSWHFYHRNLSIISGSRD